MSIKDVEVIITRDTMPVTQTGYGLPLVVDSEADHPYTLYRSLLAVAQDFPVGTPVYKAAAAIFGQEPHPPQVAIFGVEATVVTEVVAALTDLTEEHDDWYFLIAADQDTPTIKALSNWAEQRAKLYFASTDDLDLADELDADRTVLMYHEELDTFPGAAWVGRCAPENPGSITWKFKRLAGIEPVAITSGNLELLHENGGNAYVTKMGRPQTSEGLVTSGEYIDVMRCQDWLVSAISGAVQRLLSTAPKVPYDNRGISLVVAELQGVLQQATAQGVILTDEDGNGEWSVSAPDRDDIAPETRARRILPDVSFEAILAGAIHGVRIRGVLKV